MLTCVFPVRCLERYPNMDFNDLADEMQVNYILDKMKVLTALQDDVRSNIHSTKCDIGRGGHLGACNKHMKTLEV